MANHRYAGGCQCGTVRFTVDIDPDRTTLCNCANCKARDRTFWFVHPEHFHLTSGVADAHEYSFNNRDIRHPTCAVCSAETFFSTEMPDGAVMIAINARSLVDNASTRLRSGASSQQSMSPDPSEDLKQRFPAG
jgi:hypothetical protein